MCWIPGWRDVLPPRGRPSRSLHPYSHPGGCAPVRALRTLRNRLDRVKEGGCSMASVDERVLQSLDESYTIDLLCKLISFPSYFPNYEEIAAFVESEMKRYGLDVFVKGDSGTGQVQSQALAERALVYTDEYGEAMGRPWTRPNVVGSIQGTGGGPTLIVRAHTDVVPAYNRDLWKTDPFVATEIDGMLYGRGAADAKGSLAAMMAATRAIKESGLRLGGNLLLVARTPSTLGRSAAASSPTLCPRTATSPSTSGSPLR